MLRCTWGAVQGLFICYFLSNCYNDLSLTVGGAWDTLVRDITSEGHFIQGTFHPGNDSSKGHNIQGMPDLRKNLGTHWSGTHCHSITTCLLSLF
jgi:hypothetical protein